MRRSGRPRDDGDVPITTHLDFLKLTIEPSSISRSPLLLSADGDSKDNNPWLNEKRERVTQGRDLKRVGFGQIVTGLH